MELNLPEYKKTKRRISKTISHQKSSESLNINYIQK